MKTLTVTLNPIQSNDHTTNLSGFPADTLIATVWRGPIPNQVVVVRYFANPSGDPLGTEPISRKLVTVVKDAIAALAELGPLTTAPNR